MARMTRRGVWRSLFWNVTCSQRSSSPSRTDSCVAGCTEEPCGRIGAARTGAPVGALSGKGLAGQAKDFDGADDTAGSLAVAFLERDLFAAIQLAQQDGQLRRGLHRRAVWENRCCSNGGSSWRVEWKRACRSGE